MSRSGFVAVVVCVALPAGVPTEASDPSFSNMTNAAGVAVTHSIAGGFAHDNYTGGGTVGDFNNDGWQDLYVISGGEVPVTLEDQPDHLFINNGDGTFTDRAAEWGLTAIHRGKGASVGDFNKDGWLDLYVTSAGPPGPSGAAGRHKLYQNNGDGTFTDVAAAAGVNFTTPTSEDGFGSTFGDYDLDGDLDLFVAGFATNNTGLKLFRNNGDGTFTDQTSDIDFDNPDINGFAPRFADMDGDWYPELLVASDFGSSVYLRNNTDGTFDDVTAFAGTGYDENGMGQAVGDFDGNGFIDWYVTSIYLPSNQWTGNKLYLNQQHHSYDEVSEASGVADGGYGWGALAVDFNHDGLLDIAETNGDTFGIFAGEQAYLWIQNGGGTYDEMAMTSGFVHTGNGRGMSNFDYDNDGDQDVVIFAYNEPLMLFRNDVAGAAADANWLRVFLDSSASPGLAPRGTGARVYATVGGESQLRMITSGDNFLSHSELSAHFGLGSATVVDELRVDWPDGSSTILTDVAANQTLTVASGPVMVTGDLTGDGLVNASDLAQLLGSWGVCGGCPADIDGDGTVTAADLAMLLGNWTA